MYGRQTSPGVPGSFPLPNPGNVGNAYQKNAMHPAAAAGLAPGRANLSNGGRPTPAGKK